METERLDRALTRRAFLHRAGLMAMAATVIPILQACANRGAGGGPAASTGGSSSAATPSGPAVRITDTSAFQPQYLTVQAGDTVTWTNEGAEAHSVTCDPDQSESPGHVRLPEGVEPWESGDIAPGGTFTHTFDVAGEYAYFCLPHDPAEVGYVTVRE